MATSELKLTYLTSDADKKMAEGLDDPLRRQAYLEYRDEFYQASRFEKRFEHPVHVDIELTNTCNYRCVFCEHGLDEAKKNPYYKSRNILPKQKVFDILDECKAIGVKSIQFSVINEPLLYRDIVEVVAYAGRLGFPDVFFMTNGSLLDREKAIKLIEAGMTKIMFSLDAVSEDVYRSIRRKEGCYEKTVQNILSLLALKKELNLILPLTRVSFVISDLNKHEKERFVEFWKDRVDFIAIQNLIDLEGEKPRDGNEGLKGYRCNMSYFRLAVKADGRVNPCCVFYGDELVFGNVYEKSLAEIWNSREFREFQEMHKNYGWNKNLICHKCVLNTTFSE